MWVVRMPLAHQTHTHTILHTPTTHSLYTLPLKATAERVPPLTHGNFVTAAHCNTATRCNALQHNAAHYMGQKSRHCTILQRCNALKHTATHCNTLLRTTTHCITVHGATESHHCNTLQRVPSLKQRQNSCLPI